MTHQLTLEIPDEVYQPLVEKAQAVGQTVETVASACLAQSVGHAEPGGPLRQLGTLQGTITYIAPDFDAPLDEFREYTP